MSYNSSTGPQFQKRRGGTGRRKPTGDDIFGLVSGGASVVGGVQHDTIYKFIQLSDAEALGIDAAYDTTNHCQIHYNIAQFFEYCPSGTLYFILGDNSVSGMELLEAYVDYNAGNVLTQKLLREAPEKIKFVGVVLNPHPLVPLTYTGDIYENMELAVQYAQNLVSKLREESIMVDGIMLSGIMKLNGTAAISTYPSLRALECEDVMCIWACDPDNTLLEASAIGGALGMMAQRKVSECLGAVNIANKPDAFQGSENYSLTRKAAPYWLDACLPTGRMYNTLTAAEKSELDEKGYIYALKFQDYEGIYFSDSHTCTDISSDYAYGEDNRVWNKAVRLVRAALIPLMRGELEIDSTTGNPSDSVLAAFRRIGVNALSPMIKAREIAQEVNIDFVDTGTPFSASGEIVLDIQYFRNGILRKLTGTIGQ
jgi:hypothetical protein